ncbi:3-beta-hydroxysteroid sulfotransferase-like [Haemaphysalis longicornis]
MAEFQHHSSLQVIDGDLYTITNNATLIREVLHFQPSSEHVIIVSYYASGTHWMQQMCQLILHGGLSAATHGEFWDRSPFLEDSGIRVAEATSSPRLLTTHLRPGKITINDSAKYVYVCRNPRDVCVSLYDFLRQMPVRPIEIPFDEFVDMFLLGRLPMPEYFGHVYAGFLLRDKPNVFFVTYEEITKDTPGVVVQLAKFLGEHYMKKIQEDERFLSDILEQCSAEYMKKLLEVPKSELVDLAIKNQKLLTAEEVNLKFREGDTVKFVRHAKVGRWRDVFTKAQLRRTFEKITQMYERTAVEVIWPDIFNDVCTAVDCP